MIVLKHLKCCHKSIKILKNIFDMETFIFWFLE